jgi:hypothetical protein
MFGGVHLQDLTPDRQVFTGTLAILSRLRVLWARDRIERLPDPKEHLMQHRTRRIRILSATSIVALAALATSSAGNALTIPKPPKPVKQLAQLRSIQDRDGETYVWIVNGVQTGLPFK